MDKTKRTEIEILKVVGYTESEAEKALKMGTMVINSEDINAFLQEWNVNEEEPITLEAVRKGSVTDFELVNYNNDEYLIVVVR